MLFINEKRHNIDDFVKELSRHSNGKIDFDELKKNPSFIPNEALEGFDIGVFSKTGRKVRKVGHGGDVLSVFRFFSEKTNEQIEVRYSAKLPHKDPRTELMVYTPRAIDVDADEFQFQPREIEMALYLYVHPQCKQSPFRQEGSVHQYSHNSIKDKMNEKNNTVTRLEACLSHASALPAEELKIFSKGIGMFVDERYTSDQLRTELKNFAITNVVAYSKAMSDETVKFIGMIQDAMDKNYIVSERISNNTVWSYAKGFGNESIITSVAPETPDPVAELKRFMMQHIAEHYPLLSSLNKDVLAKLKANEYLETLKTNQVPNNITELEGDTMTLEHVKDFASAKEYLKLSHPEEKNSSQKKTADFLAAVSAGEITEENVANVIHDYIAAM